MKSAVILVLCSLFFFPQVSKSQKIERLCVDGDTAVAYTSGSIVMITERGNTLKNINTPEDLKNSLDNLYIKGNMLIAAKNYGSNYLSTNKGTDWKKFILSEKSERITAIATNGSKLYLGSNDGLYVSETKGDSWQKMPGLKKTVITSLTFDGNTIYATGYEAEKYSLLFLISTDGGQTWTKSPEGLPKLESITFTILKNSVLYGFVSASNSKGGIYTYDASTKIWSQVTTADKFQVFPSFTSMAISDTNFVLSSYDYLYYLSSDKGKTWKSITTDFPSREFEGGEQLIYDDGVLYTVTKDGRLFLSKDNGAKWSKCKWQADADKAKADALQAEKDKENAKYAKIKRYNDSVATAANVRGTNDKIIKNYFKGIAEMSYSNYDSALVKLNAAIAAKPDFAKAYEARMKCFSELKQTDNAKKDSTTLAGILAEGKVNPLFEDHFKLDETEVNNVSSEWHTDCYHKDAYGWYMRAKKSYSSDDQLKFLWKAVELDDTKAEYYIMLGDVSRDKLYDVAAETHYKKAIALNPNCQWYDFDRTRMVPCGNCNGKGYRLQVNITQQKVNNTTHSTSDSERIACTECYQGYVKIVEKIPSVKLVK